MKEVSKVMMLPLKDLMPTLKFDVQLVNETEGKLENFKKVTAEVLLLNGSKSPIFLKHSYGCIKETITSC